MKKVLVFLLMCLSSTVMFAQAPHYEVTVAPGNDGNYMTFNAVIQIDGEEQYNTNLELALFETVDGVCRGTKFPPRELPNGRIYYSVSTYGETNEMYTFKVYDHENEMELPLEVVWLEEWPQPVYNTNGYGALRNPFIANFITSSTGITKDITPWTVETTQGEQKANGWYLLASPVGTIDNATTVTNLLSYNYDLYAFNEAQELEWLNYDGDDEYAGHFSIEAGKGYLYANSGDGVSETVTLTFPGDANTNDVTISLAKTEGAGFEGWNLIGNPFNENYPMGNRSFYVMNEDGTEVGVANRNYLEPMEGAFISTEQDGEEFTFSLGNAVAPYPEPEELAINIGQSNKVVDRAVVSIGESRSELPKFQLNPNHTKVFIPKEGKDYAVVSAGEMGEMPVNFKAEKSGTYTMNLSSQNVKFSYLHLIDNLTGNDVDLLANPTYSFNAQTTDYASRFRLVFATDSSVNSDSFGFVNSSGNFCVYGIEGEATLQVYDVLGHMLSSETFSGSIEKKVNAATGVYMMRLINGNDVKVQKVIIK